MSTITDPNIFAGRLARDSMHGWCVFIRREHEDLCVFLERYPVTYVGGGYMRLAVDLPPDMEDMNDCYRVVIFSRKGHRLHEFAVTGTIDRTAKGILWIPPHRQ
jgi:hypothetical protein